MSRRLALMRALTAFALGLVASLALPVTAQLVPYAGKLVDPAEVPRGGGTPGSLLPVDSPSPSVFGTTLWTVYGVGPCDGFVRPASPAISDTPCTFTENATTSGSALVGFPVHVPSGVSVQIARLYYYENDVASKPLVGFYKVDHINGAITQILLMDPPGTSGGNSMYETAPFAETIDNYKYTYNLLVDLPRTATATTRLYQILLYYKLQVSPAPGVASFSDVPTSYWAFQWIEALKASGITQGVTPTTYEPESNVTRAQMAVFLAKALGLTYQY